MRNSKTWITWALASGLALGLLVLPADADAQTLEVTITNLTRGQIFSPPIVYTHRSGYRLFSPGEPAISELAGVAEDADNDPLIALLGTEPAVGAVGVGGGPVLPGESMTVRVDARQNAQYVSALGMLVTTNDAFFAGSARLSGVGTSFYAPAWDAGSEANTQSCSHIPGPPCGNGGVRVTAGAEGYVSVHAGIQDRGSLDDALHDWRNPVARIQIRRVSP